VPLNGVEDRVRGARSRNTFSTRRRDGAGQDGGTAGDELPAPQGPAARKIEQLVV
jgi:hypothetical protein